MREFAIKIWEAIRLSVLYVAIVLGCIAGRRGGWSVAARLEGIDMAAKKKAKPAKKTAKKK
jgi:hypothetical protein